MARRTQPSRAAELLQARVLPNAASVFGKLRELFSPKTRGRRRVIVVAYVGRDACQLLPDLRDVELYCWPQVGATDPYALAELQREPYRAKIRLVKQLHMKLYWVDSEGFVVTSANLSRRALGSSIREEIGVYCPDSNAIDIDQITGRLSSYSLSSQELERLFRYHDKYWANVPREETPSVERRRASSFLEWYTSERLPKWKLGWWDGEAEESPSTARMARELHGVESIEDYIPCLNGQIAENDWILCFRLTTRNQVSDVSWLRADVVYRVLPHEAKRSGYTHEAVQLRPLHREHRPPFSVPSNRVLEQAVRAFGATLVQEAQDLRPTPTFLRLLAQAHKTSPRSRPSAI